MKSFAHVSLEVVNGAVHSGQLDQSALLQLRDGLLNYVRQAYAGPDVLPDSPAIQNKIAQTLTFLFELLYEHGWETFFDDLKAIANGADKTFAGHIIYLRTLVSVHDEIADQLLNTSTEKQKRSVALKDAIRERDVSKIALSWQEILGSGGRCRILCLSSA